MEPEQPTANRARDFVAAMPRSILLESAKPDRPARSLLFHEPLEWIEVRDLGLLPCLFERLEQARAAGHWCVGYLAYECGYHWQGRACPGFQPHPEDPPLAVFGIYSAPHILSLDESGPNAARGLTPPEPSWTEEQFGVAFAQIQELIAAGDSYQVNLTFRVQAAYANAPSALFAHMMARQPVEFGAMLNLGGSFVLSASPELFFRLDGRHIRVRPMKGTAPRGASKAEDDRLAAELATDEKNRAENVMIVDLLRNDLGRVAETGSVVVDRLFDVERLPSLMQMTSEISATLRPEIGLYELFDSLFPSGSIVGAPKLRTMQIIRGLEARDRGVYTGTIGYIAPDGTAEFSVAIRTGVLREGIFRMGIGAGITSSSQADAEYAECLLKARFLLETGFELIETMRFQDGRCDLLDLHLDRMQASAAHFGFCFERDEIAAQMLAAAAQLSPGVPWRLRFTLGADGQLPCGVPQEIVNEQGPLCACLWPVPVQSSDTWLRHKSTRRAVYDDALQAARKAGCVDALFVNEQGNVTEGAIHSIFVRHGDRWRTPPLAAGVLPGVRRRTLLRDMPRIVEANIALCELLAADEVWLTNAVRGIRKVTVRRAARL